MSPITPYISKHEHPNGPGDERPTAQQVIDDEGLVEKLGDKVILITGCTSGLGIEAAKALYTTGATIYITGRSMAKAQDAANEIASDPKRPVHPIEMSLDSLASVRAGAADFLEKSKKLNVLITNAGIMAAPYSLTQDGFESQFGTNHVGHFLLFQLLKPALLASSTPSSASRVVSVSSSGHRICGLHFGNYNFDADETDPYNPWAGYGQSKTANIYLANEIDRRYGARGLHGLSLHPGTIMTGLGKHVGDDPLIKHMMEDPDIQKLWKSPQQGAATHVWAAVGKELEGKGGLFLDNVGEAELAPEDAALNAPGYAKHAFDEESEDRLWKDSLKMVGMEDDDE